MSLDVVELTSQLISYHSVSQLSNVSATRYTAKILQAIGFAIEELSYTDAQGVDKLSIIGKLGQGTGGLRKKWRRFVKLSRRSRALRKISKLLYRKGSKS